MGYASWRFPQCLWICFCLQEGMDYWIAYLVPPPAQMKEKVFVSTGTYQTGFSFEDLGGQWRMSSPQIFFPLDRSWHRPYITTHTFDTTSIFWKQEWLENSLLPKISPQSQSSSNLPVIPHLQEGTFQSSESKRWLESCVLHRLLPLAVIEAKFALPKCRHPSSLLLGGSCCSHTDALITELLLHVRGTTLLCSNTPILDIPSVFWGPKRVPYFVPHRLLSQS